jgi:hypothetical protein
VSPAVVKRRNEQENDRGQSSDPEEPAPGHGLRLVWHFSSRSKQEQTGVSVVVLRKSGFDFRMQVDQFRVRR